MRLSIRIEQEGVTQLQHTILDLDRSSISATELVTLVRKVRRIGVPRHGISLYYMVEDLPLESDIIDSGSSIELKMNIAGPFARYVIVLPANEGRVEGVIYSMAAMMTLKQFEALVREENCEIFDVYKNATVSTTVYRDGRSNRSPDQWLERSESTVSITLDRLTKDTEQLVRSMADEILLRKRVAVAQTVLPASGHLTLGHTWSDELARDHDWVLWSEEILQDVRSVCDIPIPVDKLKQITQLQCDVVLVGVAGCGKSRTCLDFCRSNERLCIYMDWANHGDLYAFMKTLPALPVKDRGNQELKRLYSNHIGLATMRLLISRLMIVKTLSRDECWDIMRIGGPGISHVAMQLTDNQVESVYTSMIEWARKMRVCFVMDESHQLLQVLEGSFHSITSSEVSPDGRYVYPRSYLSFLLRFIRETGLRSVWAGTHLRLNDLNIFYSARLGYGPRKPVVFTEFNFLTSANIYALLTKWLRGNVEEKLKRKISLELQGRPRLLMTLISTLGNSDDSVGDVYEEVYAGLMRDFVEFWDRASLMTIADLDPDTSDVTKRIPVMSLLEDLIYNDYFIDLTKREHGHWYRSLVATSLVMLGDVNGNEGLLCEPIVLRAGKLFAQTRQNRDLPFESILYRDLVMKSDAATRGKAVEALTVVRVREGFWTNPQLFPYYPDALMRIVEEGISLPLGIYDCRNGVSNHAEKLRDSFLNPDATHVVLTRERSSAADVVYGYFTFHIKTKWVDVNGRPLVISDRVSESNLNTIDNTFISDERMEERSQEKPWLCVCFEFPTNAEMVRGGVTEIVDRQPLRTVVTASINSPFTRFFFGTAFVDHVNRLVSHT